MREVSRASARPAPSWDLLALAALALLPSSAAGAPDVSPDQIWQIVSVGGGTAVLGLMVYLFLAGKIVPESVVEDRDGRIARLEKLLERAEQERDTFRTLAERTQGSQRVQTETLLELTDAITAALDRVAERQRLAGGP